MDFLKDFFNNFVGRFQIATYLTTESSQKYFLTKKNSSVLIFLFLYHLGIPTWACMFTYKLSWEMLLSEITKLGIEDDVSKKKLGHLVEVGNVKQLKYGKIYSNGSWT